MTTISNPIQEDGMVSAEAIRLEYPNEGKHLVVDREICEELRLAYNKAVEDKCDAFMFHDHKFLTSYAKYLLEYVDRRLGNEQETNNDCSSTGRSNTGDDLSVAEG